MKSTIFFSVIFLSLLFVGCSNSFATRELGEEKTPFKTVLILVEDSDVQFARNIEYHAVKELRDNGVEAFSNYELQEQRIDKDTLNVCLILSKSAPAKLVSIKTNRTLLSLEDNLNSDLYFSSEEIVENLVNEGILARTDYANDMSKKQAGAFIWSLSAILFLFL